MNTINKYILLFQFFISGFAALSYQIVSFKLVSSSGLGDAISVAISLTAFVSLSGIGSLFGARIEVNKTWLIEFLLGACAIILFSVLFLFGAETIVYFSSETSLHLKLVFFIASISPLAILSGVLIPLHQKRIPLKNINISDDFNRFFFIYFLFHIGGAFSLIIMEIYGFSAFGWIQLGIMLGALSLFNSFIIVLSKKNKNSITECNFKLNFKNNKNLYIILFAISIISGYIGIISYRLFDYLTEPNIRNYTIVTALIFIGLSFSSLLVKKINISINIVYGFIGLSILAIFISGIHIPKLITILTENGVNHWLIYFLSGVFFIIPIYILLGASIPAFIKQGMASGHALFIVSMGNAIGYWFYVFTAKYNIDTIILLSILFFFTLLTTKRIIFILVILFLIIFNPLFKSYHNATHQIFLHNQFINEQPMIDRIWNKAYNQNKDFFMDTDYLSYDFDIQKSWNTYGWSVDVTNIKAYNKRTGGLSYSEEHYVISGSRSLSLNPPEIVTFTESMVAAIPAFFVHDFNNGLVLGSGSGISAKVVGANFENTEVVDLSPDAKSQLEYFKELNNNVIDDINLIKEDALSYLSKHNTTDYDYIFSTVTGSGYPMSYNLYTKEFFQSASTSLSENGVFAIWLDRRASLDGALKINNSMKDVFNDTKVFRVLKQENYLEEKLIPYLVIVGSNEKLIKNKQDGRVAAFMLKRFNELVEKFYDDEALVVLGEDLNDIEKLLSNHSISIFNTDSESKGNSSINSLAFAYLAKTRLNINSILFSSISAIDNQISLEGESVEPKRDKQDEVLGEFKYNDIDPELHQDNVIYYDEHGNTIKK